MWKKVTVVKMRGGHTCESFRANGWIIDRFMKSERECESLKVWGSLWRAGGGEGAASGRSDLPQECPTSHSPVQPASHSHTSAGVQSLLPWRNQINYSSCSGVWIQIPGSGSTSRIPGSKAKQRKASSTFHSMDGLFSSSLEIQDQTSRIQKKWIYGVM